MVFAGHAVATTVSLAGTIRAASGGAISGANVYVRRIQDPSGSPTVENEIGPATSSSSGGFYFYNLAPGLYIARITISSVNVWRGEVKAPGEIPPIILH